MVNIQVDMDENENRIVELFKIANNLLTKEAAIKKIIQKQNIKISGG